MPSPEIADPAQDHSLDLTIVVPCKNEEERVVATLRTIARALSTLPWRYEVLVIDDGSSDRTAERVETFLRENPDAPVRLHRNPKNLGLSRSYVDGAFLARGKYYRLTCGDDAEPEEAMRTILGKLGQADIIIPYHSSLTGKSAIRTFVSKLYTALVNLFSGNSIRYYNGCPVHLRYHVLRWHSYAFGFGCQADFVTRLIDEGATYLEVAVDVTHVEKESASSPFKVRNVVSTVHTLAEIFRRRINKILFG